MSYLFISNKYYKHYRMLCERSKLRIYPNVIEKHHIVPRCLGGDDSYENIAYLTPREHFIAHLLLTKITTGQDKSKMFLAARNMCRASKFNTRNFKITARVFENIKINSIAYFKSTPSKKKGVPISEEQKAKIRSARKNQIITNETKKKMSLSMKKLVWINNSIHSKRVHSDKLNEYLNSGYSLGRLKNYITDEFKAKLSTSTTKIWNERKVR